MSGGSGGFIYDGYAFCSPPIMSNTDPLLLAALSPPISAPPPLQSEEPHMQLPQPPGGLASLGPLDETQAPPPPPPPPPAPGSPGQHAAQQMTEMACTASMVDEVPCCPLVMPLSLDVRASEPPPAPQEAAMPPPSYASCSSTKVERSAAPPPPPPAQQQQQQQPPVVLHQPFSSVAGAKGSSLPQSPGPTQLPAGPGESDGEGRLGRGGGGGGGGFVDSTIKTLDEKLRNLLYQEYAPMYPSGTAAETPGSGTEYVQSPPGPDSAAGTPGPMGEGRYRAGEQLVKGSRGRGLDAVHP